MQMRQKIMELHDSRLPIGGWPLLLPPHVRAATSFLSSLSIHSVYSVYEYTPHNITIPFHLAWLSDPGASFVASCTRSASRWTFLSPKPYPIWRTTSHPGNNETAQSPKFRYTPPTSAMIGTLFKPYCPS